MFVLKLLLLTLRRFLPAALRLDKVQYSLKEGLRARESILQRVKQLHVLLF